ncbi:MAG TPA: 50S ribosomal protein L22 [Candidatus Omnitrophica bacterium]|nr:50S ribosomal protein L22 [Candidatus Omnitrophota bacterium]
MAVIKAKARFVKISPRKARLVLDMVRGKSVIAAQAILANMDKKSAGIVSKLLGSAIANAENNKALKKEDLYISAVFADQGPTLHRYKAATMGRASAIRKRTSHITVELDHKKKAGAKKEKAVKGGKK